MGGGEWVRGVFFVFQRVSKFRKPSQTRSISTFLSLCFYLGWGFEHSLYRVNLPLGDHLIPGFSSRLNKKAKMEPLEINLCDSNYTGEKEKKKQIQV